jgi:cytochrome o ubiquinol oxidase subunit 2
MYFNVDAVSAEAFASWLNASRSVGQALDRETYADLAKPSQAVAPFTYRAVTPGLFYQILSAAMPPDDASRQTHSATRSAAK